MISTISARRLLAGSALPTLASLALASLAAPAFAQVPAATTTPTPPAPSEATGPNSPAAVDAATGVQQTGTQGDEIVVTGSLLRRTSTETPSPVTVLTADSLVKSGITNINDAIRSVSADGAGSISTGFQGGFSAGGAAVSLRGLGVSSTLVLIDGLRSTNFPLNDDGHNAYTDLNSIPFSAVERVEVLKDGASSTYGADAIGGVVNIIMKKNFQGVAGTVEGGISQHGDAARQRANLTLGYGDYDATGWNFYVNGEYQHDGRVAVKDRGFPFNTTDLSSIGGNDGNTADSSLSTPTINAVVRRTTQSDLNDPFTGGTAAVGTYTSLNLSGCGRTYTVTGAAGGVGCAHDNTYDYSQIQPKQERYSATGRLSIRLNDNIEGYITGTFSHNEVDIKAIPVGIRQRQPYGAAPQTASNNPGVVLPVYVCGAGVNCATAADRRLNPNNPYAAAFAGDPANGAARIYYLFGDIPTGTHRINEVIRGAAGLKGSFGDDWNWRVDAVGAKDNLTINAFGVINIAGLKQAINTGAYNFINPYTNSDAVRQQIAPNLSVDSHTSMASLDASISKDLFELPGGMAQLVVGGQIRREVEENNSLNPVLANYANTAAAFGKHTVSAGYFELGVPVLQSLGVDISGRYDHYSEGFSHFSPKIGAKWNPIKEIALRGTFSKGFRAPTFAESNPRSSFPGFVTYSPPCSFVLAHGGTGTTTSCSTTNPYALPFSVGGGFAGNPDLKPEKSTSFTAGVVAQPVRWLSLTADYYNVKKTNVIVAGPDAGKARAAYFSQTTEAAARAAVAAIPGYSVSAVDAIDPLFPNALPRVLVINGPYVNAGYFKTQGLDFSATANIPLGDGVRFTSRADVTYILKYNVNFGDGIVRKYVGTLGPYELSSGAGTPRVRGNWMNSLDVGKFSIAATTYYVSRIKSVGADEYDADPATGKIDLSCANNLYSTGNTDNFCYIKKFIYADLHASYEVNDKFTFYVDVGNFTNEKAPIAPASYSGINYLPTWHYAGVIGRTFRAGASFKF
ncbi:TonB-dependent receptor plug domain-containing protein [Sphingomonas crusticola]|uniref:TonB-dependent receptor plug domain-containing protein n=1 Tax=Sphingomonas crusticola TaxID=1697973 RepID=UPI000E21E587|nr:TonB-dependent receptor [Sphingomonas crusticola]